MPTARRAAVCGWSVAAGVYLLAVLNRTSLGVAGLMAEQRFGISPAQLSVFIFVQLGVYAAMQVPTGVLVDRYGPRRLLVTAALVLGGAQLLFALLPWYQAAVLARAVLGCGDALTFVSVLRFAGIHFSPRRYPLVVAITGTVGSAGNVLATLPLAEMLHGLGWTAGFGVAAGASLVAAVVVLAVLPDHEVRPRRLRDVAEIRAGVRAVRARVRTAWALPGTRLGFWVLFASMSVNTAFGVLWGNSYLIESGGFTAAGAGAVLMYTVLAAALCSPVFGWLSARYPAARVPTALGGCVATMGAWVVTVAVFGDHPPRPYLVGLFVGMGALSQACLTGFALARDYNGPRSLGTATGVVNVGGFVSTIAVTVGIGAALDALGGSGARSFRIAVLVAVAVQAFGTAQVVVWLRRLRSFALVRQAAGRPVPVRVVRHRWDLPLSDVLVETVPPAAAATLPGVH